MTPETSKTSAKDTKSPVCNDSEKDANEVQMILDNLSEIIDQDSINSCETCGALEELCGYHQRMIELTPSLFKKLEACEAQNAKMREALALANSMILSGEQHSETSEKIVREALSSLPTP